MKKGAQLAFDLRPPPTWGGARKGAGRKKTGKRQDPRHRTRPKISRHQANHIVMRVGKDIPRLRKGHVYAQLRRAIGKMLGNPSFRVVHLSIQRNHLHFLVEAEDKRSLSRGMQALAIAAARAVNAACGRTGKVFPFRYHATAIKTPLQARHALAYVLNNWRRHNEDEGSLASREALIDPYSSAIHFTGWKEVAQFSVPEGYEPLPVARPETWLLNVGWQRHGPISVHEVPGSIN